MDDLLLGYNRKWREEFVELHHKHDIRYRGYRPAMDNWFTVRRDYESNR